MEELIAFHPKYVEFMKQYDAQPQDAGFGVNWYDSVAFCRWLSGQAGMQEADQSYPDPSTLDTSLFEREPTSEANWAPVNWPMHRGRKGFRLPTETEWEVACRAGSRARFNVGDDDEPLVAYAWYQNSSGKHVHPPKGLCPNLRGLFDMHGNLYEWCHDWSSDFDDTPSVDSMGIANGTYRVYRGGSWIADAAACRSAARFQNRPAVRSSSLGFRIVVNPVPEPPVAKMPVLGNLISVR